MDSRIPPERSGGFYGRIGVSRADITPPVGIYARSWGAAMHDAAEGVHRPLTVTAVALLRRGTGEPGRRAESTAPLLLCGLDLGWWRSAEDEWTLRRGLLDALDLDPSRLLLCLSHTHSGPSLSRQDAERPGGIHIAPYLDSLKETCLLAIRRALDLAVPASLTWTYGVCDLAANRDLDLAALTSRASGRWPRSEGSACGYNPVTSADQTLLVGRIASESGETLATIVNYACHPTTLAWENRLISPDYVGAMREVTESSTGAPCLFLQGASGELAPREQYTADTRVADSNGRKLGYAVLSALEGLPRAGTTLVFRGVVESGARLGVWNAEEFPVSEQLAACERQAELPLKPLETAREIAARMAATGDRVVLERLSRRLNVRRAVGDGSVAAVPLWAWRIGDALLLAQPNEPYSALQQGLRARFAQRPAAVIGVANGPYAGYLTPPDAYRLGTYQAWQTPFAEGCLECFTESAITALSAMLSGSD